MEDDRWWKTTFDGKRPLMEDDSWWKTTFDGKRPLMKDDITDMLLFEDISLRHSYIFCEDFPLFTFYEHPINVIGKINYTCLE